MIHTRVHPLSEVLLLRQSFFGLPWMIAGGLLPIAMYDAYSWSRPWWTWALMIVAFMAARLAGMCLNRLIDHEIDAKNPRTALRALPRGALSRRQVVLYAAGFLCIFYGAAYAINTSCFVLSLPVSILLLAYSFTKRITALCHFVLGLIQCIVPMAASIAITGAVSPESLFLGLSLGSAIAANDCIYALQDMHFDRQEGLYSIPARYGEANTHRIVRLLHLLSCCSLIMVGVVGGFSWLYFTGVIVYAGILLRMHKALHNNVFKINELFAFTNTATGVVVLASVIGEGVWRMWW